MQKDRLRVGDPDVDHAVLSREVAADRRASDEVGLLVERDGEPEPGRLRVVDGPDVVTEVAEALLAAQRVECEVPRGSDAELLPALRAGLESRPVPSPELAAFLAGQYADAGWSRTDHYAWISGLLLELGVTSLGELSEVLVGVDETEINARMDYRYPPGAVRRLDDALLASYAQAYVDLHGNAHRVDLLRARLAKLTG